MVLTARSGPESRVKQGDKRCGEEMLSVASIQLDKQTRLGLELRRAGAVLVRPRSVVSTGRIAAQGRGTPQLL